MHQLICLKNIGYNGINFDSISLRSQQPAQAVRHVIVRYEWKKTNIRMQVIYFSINSDFYTSWARFLFSDAILITRITLGNKMVNIWRS